MIDDLKSGCFQDLDDGVSCRRTFPLRTNVNRNSAGTLERLRRSLQNLRLGAFAVDLQRSMCSNALTSATWSKPARFPAQSLPVHGYPEQKELSALSGALEKLRVVCLFHRVRFSPCAFGKRSGCGTGKEIPSDPARKQLLVRLERA